MWSNILFFKHSKNRRLSVALYFIVRGHTSKTSDQKLTFWSPPSSLFNIVRLKDIPAVHGHPDRIARKNFESKIFCDPDVCGRGRGVGPRYEFPKYKKIVCGRPVYGRPPPIPHPCPRSSTLAHTPPPFQPDVLDGWPLSCGECVKKQIVSFFVNTELQNYWPIAATNITNQSTISSPNFFSGWNKC